MSALWLPKGFHTITPNIIVDDVEQAAEFFKKAFGASETYRLTLSSGQITHCEVRLGDSIFNLGASMEGWPAHGLVAQIYVERLRRNVRPCSAGWSKSNHADDGHVLRFA
jgi:hypothetical protein